jgi:hypothetical protein
VRPGCATPRRSSRSATSKGLASERAETNFQLASPYPRAFRSEATLGLIQGKILHFLGKTDQELLRIEQSANLQKQKPTPVKLIRKQCGIALGL